MLNMREMLIVEDEKDICDCLQQFFRSKGFSVATVFSGEEALESLKAHSFDIILLDILLPGVSGMEVLKRARSLHPRARIIMVTGLDQQVLREEARRCGAVAYVTKPFDFSLSTWSAVFDSAYSPPYKVNP